MPDQIYVGIDPGQHGAIAILGSGGELLDCLDLPVLGGEPLVMDLHVELTVYAPAEWTMVAIEEPFANNRASSISQMNQGILYGILLGALMSAGHPIERIKPQRWKSEMSVPMGSKYGPKEKKELARKRANDLWPESAHFWAAAKHHDRAEAALIGECLRRRVMSS